jgi:hypothetical protein
MQEPEFTNWHKSERSDDGRCVEIAFTNGILDGSLTPEG